MDTAVALIALCMCAVLGCAILWLVSQQKGRTRKSGSSAAQNPCANATFGDAAAWAAPSGTSAMHTRNAAVVADMNRSGGCFDFVLYGDSITAFLGNNPQLFTKHFGSKSAALGVSGNSVEQLAWRIMKGDERPARAPRCIAFNIGINNLIWGNFDGAVGHMQELLAWCRNAYPSTHLVLMALLPVSRQFGDVASANRAYRALAQRMGIAFVECGQSLDPTDTSLFSDGLHPTARGHDIVLKCLRAAVSAYV